MASKDEGLDKLLLLIKGVIKDETDICYAQEDARVPTSGSKSNSPASFPRGGFPPQPSA